MVDDTTTLFQVFTNAANMLHTAINSLARQENAMKTLPALLTVAAILLVHGSAFAVGGSGATCNPSTPNWGSCELAPVPFQSSVTKTLTIPGGNHNTPFQASQANTRYVLQSDMTADGTAVEVKASYVIIDLNGYTITYNQVSPGEGVTSGAYNLHHVAVRNGSIIQGAAMSEGDQWGSGISPVSTYSTILGGTRQVNNFHVSNLYVRIGGRDMGGIVLTGNDALIEQNTVDDRYQFGTLKNRHQGNDAITATKGIRSERGVYRYNTIVNCRHRGIKVGNNESVYQNHITTRTIATNGMGISGWEIWGAVVHNNTIISRGEHPIGIGFGSEGGLMKDIKVYENFMDSKTTAIGSEYSDAYLTNPNSIIKGNFAVGFRTTWGSKNLKVYNNEISVKSDSNFTGTYSPTGATAYINAGARGLMVGVPNGDLATFSNNKIIALDKDGTGKAYGIACTHNFSDSLFFLDNTVVANITNIVLGDEYGRCEGFPLFRGNTLIKSDNWSIYNTYTNQLGGYYNAEARIVSDKYENGASVNSLEFNPSGGGIVNVFFGESINDTHLYSYRIHDNNNASKTLLKVEYHEKIQLSYSYPSPAIRSPEIYNINATKGN